MSSADWDSDATDTIEAPGARGSVNGHHVVDSCPDDVGLSEATVALMSYTIGVNNNELNNNRKWAVTYRKLQDDIKAAFEHEVGIQILLLSEFGNMFTSCDEKLCRGHRQPSGRRCTPSASSWRICLKTLGWRTYMW